MSRVLLLATALAACLAVYCPRVSAADIQWREASTNRSWVVRSGAAAAVCNDTLYLAGGKGGTVMNDVHRLSVDSSAWVQDTAAAPWNARWRHEMTAVDATHMILLGGEVTGNVRKNDVWLADCSASNSSLQWTALSNAPWIGRVGFAALVWRDKLWVFGGVTVSLFCNDVWSLTLSGDLNSTAWVQETAAAAWSARYGFGAVVFDDAMYVMGGAGQGGYRNDVWRLSDPSGSWAQLDADACSPRHNFGAGVAMHRIVMVGGTSSTGALSDSCSFNGSVWQVDSIPANGGGETAVRLLPSWQAQLWWLGSSVGLDVSDQVYITASSASNATSSWPGATSVSSSSTAVAGQSSTAVATQSTAAAGQSSTASAAVSSTGLRASSTGGSGCAASTCSAHAGKSGISVGWMQATALIAMIVAAAI